MPTYDQYCDKNELRKETTWASNIIKAILSRFKKNAANAGELLRKSFNPSTYIYLIQGYSTKHVLKMRRKWMEQNHKKEKKLLFSNFRIFYWVICSKEWKRSKKSITSFRFIQKSAKLIHLIFGRNT